MSSGERSPPPKPSLGPQTGPAALSLAPAKRRDLGEEQPLTLFHPSASAAPAPQKSAGRVNPPSDTGKHRKVSSEMRWGRLRRARTPHAREPRKGKGIPELLRVFQRTGRHFFSGKSPLGEEMTWEKEKRISLEEKNTNARSPGKGMSRHLLKKRWGITSTN